jgi:hypothetical protein
MRVVTTTVVMEPKCQTQQLCVSQGKIANLVGGHLRRSKSARKDNVLHSRDHTQVLHRLAASGPARPILAFDAIVEMAEVHNDAGRDLEALQCYRAMLQHRECPMKLDELAAHKPAPTATGEHHPRNTPTDVEVVLEAAVHNHDDFFDACLLPRESKDPSAATNLQRRCNAGTKEGAGPRRARDEHLIAREYLVVHGEQGKFQWHIEIETSPEAHIASNPASRLLLCASSTFILWCDGGFIRQAKSTNLVLEGPGGTR